ncbi:MAG: hypothetical protein ACUVR2_06720 [Anaerolineae bacterium]
MPFKRSRHLRHLVAVAVTLCILASCGFTGLPSEGKAALDEAIARLAGTKVNYKIISAQKAPGTVEEQSTVPQVPSNIGIFGCPPDSGDRETWCIVIGPEITDKIGRHYSHFLLRRLGNSWYVEELTEAGANRFEYVGCSNWNAQR